MSATVAIRRALPALTPSARGAAREQALVVSGQLASGLGNLVFTVAMARVLEPAGFAQLAAFMALFLLIYLPTRSLSAGSALTPDLAAAARRRTATVGALVAAAICAVGIPLAPTLGISVALVVALATTPPLAGLLALERGRLYGERRHRRVFASLVVEPAVRLAVGIALAFGFGVAGAGMAVVFGSVAALAIAAGGREGAVRKLASAAGRADSRLAVIGFLLLAVIQAQDVIFANATLRDSAAAGFAVISTLGGVAAFATTTVPLVLLPQARDREPGALGVALGATALLGAAAIAPALIAPELLLELGFGAEYAGLAPIAAPYLLAMALLGVARVLVANAIAAGTGRAPIALAAAAALLQLGLLLALGDSPAGVANATLAATAALTAGLAATETLRLRRPAFTLAREAAPRPERNRWRVPLLLAGLVVVGIAVRMAADRSLWLDEATTWYQSRLPFSTMLEDLRTTDVHPPGHHALVWLSVRAFGDSELALRLPSLIAGAALIPMMFVAGRALFDRRTGLVAAAFTTVAPICVWYSEEARMYAQLMLLGVVTVWALYRAVESDRLRYWAIYGIAAAAMVWTHYFAALLVGVLQVAMMILAWRRSGCERADEPRPDPWRRLLGPGFATLLMVALVLPLAPFGLDQFQANEAAGRGFDQPNAAGGAVEDRVSLYAALTNGIWAIWGYHSDWTMARLTALWPLLMLFALMLLGRGRSRAAYLLAAAVFVPALLLTAIALAHPFLFELRYNLAAVPLLVLLIAALVSRWPPAGGARLAVGALAAVTLALGTLDQQLNGSNPRVYDFEGALGEISERSGPRDLLVYDPAELNNIIDYYAPDVEKARLASGVIEQRRLAQAEPGRGRLERAGAAERARSAGDAQQGAAAAAPQSEPDPARAQRIFVLSSFRDDPRNVEATAEAVARLRAQRDLVDRFTRPQVRVWVFE